MLENRREYKGGAYDIIWVAGQSNAEGYGLGDAAPYEPYTKDEDILALRDTCGYRFIKDEKGADFLQLLGYPTVSKISVAEELLGPDGLPRASFSLPNSTCSAVSLGLSSPSWQGALPAAGPISSKSPPMRSFVPSGTF